MDFFDIQLSSPAAKNEKISVKVESEQNAGGTVIELDLDASIEDVEIIETAIKCETISSDDDEKAKKVGTISSHEPETGGENEKPRAAAMAHKRNVYRPSMESIVSDRQSTCSPSTSNLPMIETTPNSSPCNTPDIDLANIKEEPQELYNEAIFLMKTEKNASKSEMKEVRSKVKATPNSKRSNSTSTSQCSSAPQVESQQKRQSPTDNRVGFETHSTKRQRKAGKCVRFHARHQVNFVHFPLRFSEPSPSIDGIKFACFYCHNQSSLFVKTFADVYNHWKISHAVLPLRFVAVRTAACFYCDKVDVFPNLQAHHKHQHHSKVFIVVDRENKAKCALCHKIFSDSEMIGHFKISHRLSHYAHISSPICFTQSEIDQLLRINPPKSIDSLARIEAFICGLCRVSKNTADVSFMEHIEQDEFQFKCSACKFRGNSVCETARHEASDHQLPIDTTKQLTAVKLQLERYYMRTQIIFTNGLLLYRHNMLNSIFDDRKEFWPFRERLAEQKLKETTADDLRCQELQRQKHLSNNLRISGLEQAKKVDLPDIIQHLCRAVDINDFSIEKDIKQIYRRSMVVIVKLVNYELKREIVDAWRNIPERIKLLKLKSMCSKRPEIKADKISVRMEMTPFFVELSELAEKARRKHQIQSHWLTVDGLRVKHNSRSIIMWSESDLVKFIENTD